MMTMMTSGEKLTKLYRREPQPPPANASMSKTIRINSNSGIAISVTNLSARLWLTGS